MGLVGDSGDLRVGDRERDAAADQIRDAYAHGRLSYEELDTRLDAVHRATTRRELAVVSADLPAERRTKRRRSLVPWSYLEVNALLWGIWGVQVATGGSLHDLWPLFISVPWGLMESVTIGKRLSRRRTALARTSES